MQTDILYLTESPDARANVQQAVITPRTNLYAVITEHHDVHPLTCVCVISSTGLTDDQLVELHNVVELCEIPVYNLESR